MSDDLSQLTARVEYLESAIRNLKAVAKGDPGRDGKDGRDGRDGIDAKPVNYSRVLAAVRGAAIPARAASFDVTLRPHIAVSSPDIHVAAPNVNLSPIMHAGPPQEIVVRVPATVVNIPPEAIKLDVVAQVASAPEPWPIETEITDRTPDGRARVMQTRPLPK